VLIVFPHAGGSAAAYRELAHRFESDHDVRCVELPGRGRHWKQPFLATMPDIAEFAYQEVRDALASRPTILLGHSMGAWVAFLVAARARDRPPRHLVVSAARPPHLGIHRALLSPDQETLIGELDRLGGLPTELRNDRAALELFLPALRADLAAIEPFRPPLGEPLAVPVTVLRAAGDDITVDDARAWCQTTTGTCQVHTLPGGHFFLTAQPAMAQAVVRRALTS